MSWAAVAGSAIAVVGGAINSSQSRKGQQAALRGQDAATAEQRRQYDQSREDMLPWLEAGQRSLGTLERLNAGDFSSFNKSPDYQFRYDQGLQGLSRMAAARGNFRSGATDRDIIDYNQGQATQAYGDYYNRIAGLAGVGQTQSQSLGTLGQNYANNVGNIAQNTGLMQQQYYQQRGDNYGQMAAGIVGGLNSWYQNNSARNGGGTGWYLGNNPGRG